MKKDVTVRSSAAEYLTFITASGESQVEAIYFDENVWLTQKMMGVLYDVEANTITYHLQKAFRSLELDENSVTRKFRVTASDGKSYDTKHYNLKAIIAVGNKVDSPKAVQFRKWANNIIEEYTIKGFAMDDERLKNGGTVLTKKYFEELLELYQRDGFSQGYYRQHNGRNMVALENLKQQKKEKGVCQRDEALFHTLKKEYTEKKLQEKINGTLMLYTGAPAILDLEYDKIRVSVEGDRLEMAQNQALTQERIRKQMMKTGNTPFYFENLEIQTDEQGFLPMQSLNELRRKGLSLLEEQYLNSFKRTLPEKTGEQNNNYAESKSSELETSEEIYYYASVETREQLSAVLERPEIAGVYFDSTLVWGNSVEQKLDQIVEGIHKKKKEAYLMLPYILRKEKTQIPKGS